ncbi:MAG: CvpA family protein [Helicobacter sp.]|nr:CvpA family protein [Helicobacter sp.]
MTNFSFNYFDLVVLILMLLFGIRGIFNGFAKELSSFVGIIGGIFFASLYSLEIGGLISENIFKLESPSAIALTGFSSLLIGIWVISLLIGVWVQKLLDLLPIGFFKHILGFIFGFLKFFVILSIILYALSSVHFASQFLEKYTMNSYLYSPMMKIAKVIVANFNDQKGDKIV